MLWLVLLFLLRGAGAGVSITPNDHCAAPILGTGIGCPATQPVPLISVASGATGNGQTPNCGNCGLTCDRPQACLCRGAPGGTLFDVNGDGFLTNESLPGCLPAPGTTRSCAQGGEARRFYGIGGVVDYPDRVLPSRGFCSQPRWDFTLFGCSMVTSGTFFDPALGSTLTNKLFCGYQRSFLRTTQKYRGEVWYDCSPGLRFSPPSAGQDGANGVRCTLMDRGYFAGAGSNFPIQRGSFSGPFAAVLPTTYLGFIQPPRRTCVTVEVGSEFITVQAPGISLSQNNADVVRAVLPAQTATTFNGIPGISTFVRKQLLVYTAEAQCRATLEQLYCGVDKGWGEVFWGPRAAQMTSWSPIRRGRNGLDYLNSAFCRSNMISSVIPGIAGPSPRVDSDTPTPTCNALVDVRPLKDRMCDLSLFEPGDVCASHPGQVVGVLYGIPQGDMVGLEGCHCMPTRIGNNCQFDRTALCGPIVDGGGRCFGGPSRGGTCPFSDDIEQLNSCFYTDAPFCQNLAVPVPPATSLCTCNSGFFGPYCNITCTSLLNPLAFGHAACTNGVCVGFPTAQGLATACQCNVARGFFPVAGSGLCAPCNPPDCSGNGVCQPPGPTCRCNAGFQGSGCQVPDSLPVVCGTPPLNITCTLELPLPNFLGDATYVCSFAGARTSVPPLTPAGQVYPLVFACTGISLFAPLGTFNLTSPAAQCAVIKQACSRQLAATTNTAQSNDLCPLPFIDLVPPYGQLEAAFCNTPADTTAFPVPFPIQWLTASFGSLTFNGYLLSTALPGLGNANVYRFVNNPADAATITIRCDVNLTRADTLVYHNQPLALARLVLQTC